MGKFLKWKNFLIYPVFYSFDIIIICLFTFPIYTLINQILHNESPTKIIKIYRYEYNYRVQEIIEYTCM